MKKLVLIIVILISVSSFSNVYAENNMAQNPGFEDTTADYVMYWDTFSWIDDNDAVQFKSSTDVFRTGKKSILIQNIKENHSRYKQTVNSKPDTVYKMTVFAKTEGITGSDTVGANIFVENAFPMSNSVMGTSAGWEYLELYGKTGPEQTSFEVSLSLGGYGNEVLGKVWFDDFAIEELTVVPEGVNIQSIESFNNDNAGQNHQEDKGINNLFLVIIIVSVFLIMLGIFVYLFFFRKLKKEEVEEVQKEELNEGSLEEEKEELEETNKIKEKKGKDNLLPKLKKKDIIIMAVMTFIYSVIALVNLGDLKVPESSWIPSQQNESFTIDLGKDTELSRIYYYCGLGKNNILDGRLLVEYKNDSGKFEYLTTLEKKKNIFVLKYTNLPPVKTSQLKFIVEKMGGEFNEIAVFEKDSKKPLENIKIIENNTTSANNGENGKIGNLFDEPGRIAYEPSYMNSSYFDEVYHARTAFEFIHGLSVYETTHPPLGKVLIAVGVLIFGMVPFGWRIMGTLMGIIMVPVMYVFGFKAFKRSFYGFCAALLMMMDLMHFAQTRIATIDSYVTLFTIIMYYFMFVYFVRKSYSMDFVKSLRPLFLSGLFFGLGIASKWIALYGAAGLAFIFFLAKTLEYIDYREIIYKFKNRVKDMNIISIYLIGAIALSLLLFILKSDMRDYMFLFSIGLTAVFCHVKALEFLNQIRVKKGIEENKLSPKIIIILHFVCITVISGLIGLLLLKIPELRDYISYLFIGLSAVFYIAMITLFIYYMKIKDKETNWKKELINTYLFIVIASSLILTIIPGIRYIMAFICAGLVFAFFIYNIIEFIIRLTKKRKIKEATNWTKQFVNKYLMMTIALCLIFFILIPGLIYCMSYIPWWTQQTKDLNELVVDNSKSMFSYHYYLDATHPYQSDYWEWPLMTRPMAFYFGSDLPQGTISKIFTFGNPAIWWIGIVLFVVGAVIAIIKRDMYMVPIFIAVLSQYLPWFLVPRITFIYHYFTIVPFIILIIVYVLKFIYEKLKGEFLLFAYLLFSVMIFSMFSKLFMANLFENIKITDKIMFNIPLMWIIACIILIVTTFKVISNENVYMLPVVILSFIQFPVWIILKDFSIVYKYIVMAILVVISLTYLMSYFIKKHPQGKYLVYSYLVLVVIMFILFYPFVSGLIVPEKYVTFVKWLNTWSF